MFGKFKYISSFYEVNFLIKSQKFRDNYAKIIIKEER